MQAPVMTAPAPMQPTSLQPAPSAGATNRPAASVAVRADSHADAPRQALPQAPPAAPQPENISPAATASVPPLRATVNAAPAEPARKPRDAAEAKLEPKAEIKPEAKPDSIEARVRAALANADAHRPPPAEAHPMIAPAPPAAAPVIAPQPRPAENPVIRDAIATPAQQAPLQIAPATPVEIKSEPVAGVDEADAAPSADAQAQAKSEDKNPFTAFSKFLRTDTSRPPAPNEIPRPPMPIGQ
jgi:hypothetical protein